MAEDKIKDGDEDTKKEPMKTETKIGIGITILIVGAMGSYIYLGWCSFKGMDPNEWGDFMAGSIGVLALVWLIVGYFLQSKELSQNTKALVAQIAEAEKQTTELTAQATATEQLRKVTLRQAIANEKLVNMQKELSKKADNEKIEAVRPAFIYPGGGNNGIHGHMFYVSNTGHQVKDLEINVENEEVTFKEDGYKVFNTNDNLHLTYKASKKYDWNLKFSIQYTDIYGNKYVEKYEFEPNFTLIQVGDRKCIFRPIQHLFE